MVPFVSVHILTRETTEKNLDDAVSSMARRG